MTGAMVVVVVGASVVVVAAMVVVVLLVDVVAGDVDEVVENVVGTIAALSDRASCH
jgi:hypothetical protein